MTSKSQSREEKATIGVVIFIVGIVGIGIIASWVTAEPIKTVVVHDSISQAIQTNPYFAREDNKVAVEWAFIAVVGGSLVSGGFDTKEACYGHRDVMQEENHISGQCVETTTTIVGSYSSITGTTILPNCNQWSTEPFTGRLECKAYR